MLPHTHLEVYKYPGTLFLGLDVADLSSRNNLKIVQAQASHEDVPEDNLSKEFSLKCQAIKVTRAPLSSHHFGEGT